MTVIGGWLGSGKTTLLNQLLRGATERVAIVVNDVGELNIDANLIERSDDELVELTNGCVCCTIGGSLAITLRELSLRNPRPDRIVIEASGVAEPAKVARFGDRSVVPLEAIIVTADATDIRRRVEDPVYGALAAAQLDQADRVVATKLDLVPAGEAEEVKAWLRDRGGGSVDEAGPAAVEVHTATAELPEGTDAGSVAAFLADAPSSILRAKGFVSGSVIQLAAGRVTVDPTNRVADSLGRVVVIGGDPSTVDAFVCRLEASVGSRP